jgi:hypothetical protein
MKIRVRKYRCSKCKKIIKRKSDKQWIKSMCDSSGYAMARLILIKQKSNYGV